MSSPGTDRVRQTRVRRGYSRNGCARCKQQRVRCDEQHPQCRRCVRVGVACPGYEQKIRWSAKHEVFRPQSTQQTPPAQSRSYNAPANRSVSEIRPLALEPQPTSTAVATFSDRLDPSAAFSDGDQPRMASTDGSGGGPWPELLDQFFALPTPIFPGLYMQPDVPLSGGASRTTEVEAASLGPGAGWSDLLLASPGPSGLPFVLSADNNNSAVDGEGDNAVECVPRDDWALQPHQQASPASQALGLASAAASSPLPAMLTDVSTVLVEFYFKVTAQIYSCYDGHMNPFRTTVTRLWHSSRILYCTLQSMAAAMLVHDFPEAAPVGRQLRREAEALLAQATVWDDNTVLAVLMLGGSAGWHDRRDLGLAHFNKLSAYLAAAPHGGSSSQAADEASKAAVRAAEWRHANDRFLRESMLFWEMSIAFLTDSEALVASPYGDDEEWPQQQQQQQRADVDVPLPLEPHPWTGFGAETQKAMLQVGRLVRRQRQRARARRFASMADLARARQDMDAACALEAWLVRMRVPDEHAVRDTGDRNTPVWHLLELAEASRGAALVQLYHVFPDLLCARLRRESRAGAEAAAFTPAEQGKWLTAFALRILRRMQAIPAESGTSDFQPFLLVSLSSELRVAPRLPAPEQQPQPQPRRLADLDMDTVEVTRARGFVQGRLTTFLRALPPRPMEACQDIVQETWRQMDRQAAQRQQPQKYEDEADVYWMDVMMDNGWETILA